LFYQLFLKFPDIRDEDFIFLQQQVLRASYPTWYDLKRHPLLIRLLFHNLLIPYTTNDPSMIRTYLIKERQLIEKITPLNNLNCPLMNYTILPKYIKWDNREAMVTCYDGFILVGRTQVKMTPPKSCSLTLTNLETL